MSNRKILFISHDASRSGAPLTLLALIKAIKANHPEIEAHLLLLDKGVLYDDFCRYTSVVQLHKKKNIFLRIKRLLFGVSYKDDYKHLKLQFYDKIFANSVASLPTAIILKKELRCQLILYVHELSYIMSKLGASTSYLQQCDMLIAASKATKKNLIENYSISDDKITVVYPPLYYSPPKSISKKRNTQERSIIIGLSGTGCWGKGIDLLPLVIKEVVTTYPKLNCQFIWVGHLTDDTILNIEYDLKRLNILDKLTIIGETATPMDFYSKFDILLILSREESFSLSCVECIELGIPIICMQNALGVQELIGDQSVVTVPYLSITEIANAINEIATVEEKRITLINKARERLSMEYSTEKSINSIIKTFYQQPQQL